jgi:hypothetical protein
VAGRSDAGRRRFRVRADRRCTPTVGQRPPITTRTSVVATPTGLEPATSAVTGRADGRWLSMGVAGPLEFAGLRAFETLGSRWVFSGLLLPQCCPTEIIFSRDGVDPPSSPRWCRCRVVDRDSPSRRATFFNVIRSGNSSTAGSPPRSAITTARLAQQQRRPQVR